MLRIRHITLALTFLATQTVAQRTPGILGQAAPELGVESWINLPAGKKTIRLADYRGKVVYLYCFQSWCPGCHSHGFPLLSKMVSHYQGQDDVVFLAVQTVFEGFSTNTRKAANQVATKKFGLNIPIGHDVGPDGRRSIVMRRFRTGGTPWTILIDKQGVVRFNGFGSNLRPADAIEDIDRLRAEPTLIGEPFGPLDSLQFTGKPWRFADHEYSLLRWWTDACPDCKDSLPYLDTLRSKYPQLSVLAVYHQDPTHERDAEEVVRESRRHEYSGAVAIDQNSELLEMLKERGLQRLATGVSVLVDKRGVIQWVHIGHRLHDDMEGDHPEAAKALAELEKIIAPPPQMKSRR